MEHTLNCIRLAHYLGCEHISVPPGGPLDGMAEKEAIAIFHEGLDQVVPLARELDVHLLIEPEPGLLIENTKQMASFLENVTSHHVGVNFDVGHFFCVNEPPEEAFDTLFERIGHVHIEDIASTREHNHLIPGLGAIDFEAFFKKLALLDYRGDVCVELYPYIDNPVEAGVDSFKHLVPIMEKWGFEVR